MIIALTGLQALKRGIPLIEIVAMELDRVCPHCGTFFPSVEGRVFSNHVRWCKKNPKYTEIRNNAVNVAKSIIPKSNLTKCGDYKDFEVECSYCHKKFYVREREKIFPRKRKYFCCEFCRRRYRIHPGAVLIYHLTCKQCGKQFESNYSCRACCSPECQRIYDSDPAHAGHHSGAITMGFSVADKCYHLECATCHTKFDSTSYKKYCCSECASKGLSNAIKADRARKRQERLANVAEPEKEAERLKIYKSECNFTFALKDYPDEFDFDLIRKYGWYKAKNHGDNLYGVSRDHMFSVMEGFRQGIDPKIISHPANCKLVRHSDNVSKKDSCSITLEDLLKRIDAWNKKYNTGAVV